MKFYVHRGTSANSPAHTHTRLNTLNHVRTRPEFEGEFDELIPVQDITSLTRMRLGTSSNLGACHRSEIQFRDHPVHAAVQKSDVVPTQSPHEDSSLHASHKRTEHFVHALIPHIPHESATNIREAFVVVSYQYQYSRQLESMVTALCESSVA